MRRSNAAVLLAATQLCGARAPGFSIHSDLLAHPQYEVVLSDGVIPEKDAEALLDSASQHPTYSADFSQPTMAESLDADAQDATPPDTPRYSYQLMTLSPHRYLCSIPVVQPPGPENQTATELARAEEARELSRAAAHGWELLSQLQDSCLYFMSGWWSYSFCNNREITQFHALAVVPNGQPPRRDPHTPEYILGRAPTTPAASDRRARQDAGRAPLVPAELQVKGDQRYLVQKLDRGTVCDLTGRERTIEVQYHCVPGMKSDRISWIKEVTICAYVMVVNTPRLCNDVAFLPPEETRANRISCRLIARDEAETTRPLLDDKMADYGAAEEEEEAAAPEEEAAKEAEVRVGGIVVGGRSVLSAADEAGKPPMKMGHPRSNFLSRPPSHERLIEVVVQAASKEEGGKTTVLDAAELARLDLKPDVVEDMRKQMQKMAGDSGWRLEIVELEGSDVRELRGYIDDGEQEEEEEEEEEGGGEEGEEEGEGGQGRQEGGKRRQDGAGVKGRAGLGGDGVEGGKGRGEVDEQSNQPTGQGKGKGVGKGKGEAQGKSEAKRKGGQGKAKEDGGQGKGSEETFFKEEL